MTDIAMLISIAITAAHTADEIGSDGGPIWRYLAPSVPDRWTAPAYFAFQLLSVWLAWKWWQGAPWALIVLASIRVIDVLVTHTILPRVKSPNPGQATRWLLLWDVGVLVFVG